MKLGHGLQAAGSQREIVAGAPMMLDAARNATWRLLAPIALAACVTVPLGGYVLVHADQDIVRRAIAAVVFIFALLLLKGARYTGAHGPASSGALGALSGTVLGATGIGGPPVILYLLSGPDSMRVTRANLTLYVGVLMGSRLRTLQRRAFPAVHPGTAAGGIHRDTARLKKRTTASAR